MQLFTTPHPHGPRDADAGANFIRTFDHGGYPDHLGTALRPAHITEPPGLGSLGPISACPIDPGFLDRPSGGPGLEAGVGGTCS